MAATGGPPARVTDNATQREFPDEKGILNDIDGRTIRQDDDSKRDGQLVGRTLPADGGGRKIDNDAMMMGEVQSGVLEGGLHALAALLHSGVGRTDNDDRGSPLE